jgi:hypothetical protein
MMCLKARIKAMRKKNPLELLGIERILDEIEMVELLHL